MGTSFTSVGDDRLILSSRHSTRFSCPVIYVVIAAIRTRLAGDPKPIASVIEPVIDVPVGAH